MDLNQPLHNCTFVAFDTETSGAYPIGFDVVEFGAVKWSQGQVVDKMQMLFKPREPMSDFIIGIHGITNEMVAEAPHIGSHIRQIHDFFKDAVVLAHHAPFDMGFMTYEFEKAQLSLQLPDALCTSLLSRKLIHGSENHKLQTLVKFLNLDGGAAHRAYDDAFACWQLAQECFKRLGPEATLGDAYKTQQKRLSWSSYSLKSISPIVDSIVQAIEKRKNLEMVYKGGSRSGETRTVFPIGIVRNPDGDYLMAHCPIDKANKRFYIEKIKDAQVAF